MKLLFHQYYLKFLFHLILFTFFESRLFAQKFNLRGRIVDQQLNPIENCIISTSNSNISLSDKEGIFLISISYIDTVYFSHLSYVDTFIVINFKDSIFKNLLQVTLGEAKKEFETITITGKRARIKRIGQWNRLLDLNVYVDNDQDIYVYFENGHYEGWKIKSIRFYVRDISDSNHIELSILPMRSVNEQPKEILFDNNPAFISLDEKNRWYVINVEEKNWLLDSSDIFIRFQIRADSFWQYEMHKLNLDEGFHLKRHLYRPFVRASYCYQSSHWFQIGVNPFSVKKIYITKMGMYGLYNRHEESAKVGIELVKY